MSVHGPMHCIFDGISGQYNFCWVETWIIWATRRSLDLRNILSSRTSTCKTVQCSQSRCQRKRCVHFIYCSILKACMIRTHVKWFVFENIYNDSFPDNCGSCQWQLLRPLHSASHHAKIFDWLLWDNTFNYSSLIKNFQYHFWHPLLLSI